jgi:N-acetylglucosaminyldiphosphoundecaprenol N-acetyl-beta-D-mannosaminyltransferase
MAGEVKLAPPFLRKIGLEWLYRLISQPTRAKRMLDIPRFIFAAIFSRRG